MSDNGEEEVPEDEGEESPEDEGEESPDDEGEEQPEDGEGEGKRLFRSEVVILEADLRADIANHFSHTTMGSEEVFLESRYVKQNLGDWSIVHGSRYRQVGSYERDVGHQDVALIRERVEETVHGPVDVRMQVESEVIMGGAYYNTISGIYKRMAAWADFMAWGGWVEVDALRTEISGVAIRSYCMYLHNVGTRIVKANSLCDDFSVRTENFGTFTESVATETNAGTPGASETMEN